MTRPQIRSSQLVMPFGPGAMIDLPDDSVIVAGLDNWKYDADHPLWVDEPRLEEKVNFILARTGMKLRRPPAASDSPSWEFGKASVDAYKFPLWYVVQHIEVRKEQPMRRLVDSTALEGGKCPIDGKGRAVVPVRFVRTCTRGHVGDVDWAKVVHGTTQSCGGGQLWIFERGPGGDLDQIVVSCDCGAEMRMSQAAEFEKHRLGKCNGHRPWLGQFAKEACGEWLRLLIRSASNAYFAETLSVVSIPESESELDEALGKMATQVAMLKAMPKEPKDGRLLVLNVMRAGNEGAALLSKFTDDDILEAVDRSAAAASADARSVKDVEFDAMAQSKPEIGSDRPDGNFYARSLDRSQWDKPWMKDIERVVLVHRLREVTALIGFTRLEPSTVDIDGELTLGAKRAELSISQNWRPCNENRGEGFFLHFRADAVRAWAERTGVAERKKIHDRGMNLWRREHENTTRADVPIEYSMLHTLSHLLMSSIVLECGYPSASLRERVYANRKSGRFGILIMTAASDAEGTLGGLVAAGRRIANHMRRALELGRLCSNDPICSHNEPDLPNSQRLTIAACHGCVLVPETSCEQRNDFLDRALIVPTVATRDAAFFEGMPG